MVELLSHLIDSCQISLLCLVDLDGEPSIRQLLDTWADFHQGSLVEHCPKKLPSKKY